MKYIASVTTTGWTRRKTISAPLNAPTAQPSPRMIGTETAPANPSGASHTMKTLLRQKISGEIEMSKPPPMIAGVLASAAIASGATSASWLLSPNPPDSLVMFAISSPSARSNPKVKL
jgi:hypothetical protein